MVPKVDVFVIVRTVGSVPNAPQARTRHTPNRAIWIRRPLGKKKKWSMKILLRHFGWPQQALFNGSFVSMEMTSERRSSGRLANLSGRSASLRSVSEFLGNSKKSSYFFFAIVRSACAGGVEGGWCVEFFGLCVGR